MKTITIAYDESVINDVVVLHKVGESIAYKNDVLSINTAFPEYGALKITKESEDERTVFYTVRKHKR